MKKRKNERKCGVFNGLKKTLNFKKYLVISHLQVYSIRYCKSICELYKIYTKLVLCINFISGINNFLIMPKLSNLII